MGLDACVYCDCLEKGRLRNPLPATVSVKVGEDGYPVVVKGNEEIHVDHPDWSDFACIHERRELLHYRLGNITLIGLLRGELAREASSFPILCQKVVYSGCHAGDRLTLPQIMELRDELLRLADFKCVGNPPGLSPMRHLEKLLGIGWYPSGEQAGKFMCVFRQSMSELVEAALVVQKPIVF